MNEVEIRAGHVQANGIRIYYEDWGSISDDPIVLVMGLGAQLVGWPEDFCRTLVAGGHRVVRFDNRDIGRSEKIDAFRVKASTKLAYAKSRLGLPIKAPYTLYDMADDVVGLLDALNIPRANLVGASMGGMIAQIFSATYPDRVGSLVSVMSSSGARWLPQGKFKALLRLGMAPASMEREVMLNHYAKTLEIIGSPGFPMSHDERRERAAIGLDRAYHPAGNARQMLAVMSSGPRTKLLKKIQAPTLIIHGSDDPLVPLRHGRHTARCIPDARLEVIKGMGHDLPSLLLPRLSDLVLGHTTAARRLHA